MKKYIVLLIVAALLFGCLKPAAKVGCCAKANATIDGKCVLFNTTTGKLMDEYMDDTESCNVTKGSCNVTIGNTTYSVPICTDAELMECINPDCTAMICGDFIFKPKVAPGVIATEEGEADVAPPPESEEEEEALGFYRTQCRFLPMDPKLKSIMKNTKSSINVFRIGVGGNFDEYDTYRYYFPLSDQYCNVNPGIPGSSVRVDRYMNYLGYDVYEGAVPYDASEIGECMELTPAPEDPFRFGHDVQVATPAGPVYGERYEYNFAEYYKLIYPGEYENVGSSCLGEGSWDEEAPYRKVDREYYRRELSLSHLESIYDAARAPFECAGPQECYSGSCSFDFYSRGTNLMMDGEETVEFMADCNLYSTPGGRPLEVCAPTTGINPGATKPVNYGSTTVKLARIKIELDLYSQKDIMETEEITDCGTDHPANEDRWVLGCLGGSGGMGGDHRRELRREWCDFSGNDLGAYQCGDGDGVLDYQNGEQVVSQDITITGMPQGIEIFNEQKRNCEHFYGPNSESDVVPCPVLGLQSYPPAGGFVFFGKSSEPEKEVKWNGKTVIGYSFGDSMPMTLFGEGCNPQHYTDYDIIEIGEPNGETWQELMDAFAPLFDERMDEIGRDLGKGKVDDGELIISSIPWVLAYKDFEASGDSSYTISSTAAQNLKERNMLDLAEPDADGTSAAELDAHSVSKNSGTTEHSYLIMYPKFIYLYYEPSGDTFGQVGAGCAYDKATGLPSLKQYGWCEPCTISTLAYQNITASEWPYMPMAEERMTYYGADETILCECSRTSSTYLEWSGSPPSLHLVEDNVHDFVCSAPHIADMDDYTGENMLTEVGAPRTQPEASLTKERLGTYMKSGVLPVLDLSDDSNWDRTNADDPDELYSEYDFERLVGDMGAVVTIVDSVSGMATLSSSDMDEISERAAAVRTNCWRCLTSVRITVPYNNESFNETLLTLFSDPALRSDIDIVAVDYPPDAVGAGSYSFENPGEGVVEYMKNLGRMSLQASQKPVIITNFHITESSFWTLENIESVFRKIADSQADLVDSGIIGLIYMPARNPGAEGPGIVAVDGSGVGDKEEKFCTVQKGMNAFASPTPTVLYTRVAALDSVNCTRCSAYEKATGGCSRTCENGAECTLPGDGYIDPDDYKCPTGIVIEPCGLCNETYTGFVCEYRYQNGTVREETIDSSEVTSELYMDIIGGLEKPNRCCIEVDGEHYSYVQQVFTGTGTVPIVFPKNGSEGATCSMGGLDVGETTAFCGLEIVPVRNYEVSCVPE